MANKYDPRRPHDPTEKFSSERAAAIRAAAESARQMEMRSFTSGGMNVQRNTRSNIQARFANQMSLADAIERDERKSFGAPGIRATRLAKETEQKAVRADNKRPYDERRGFVGTPSSLTSPQQPTTSTTSPQSTPVNPETAREFPPFPRQQTIADFSNRVLEEARKRHPLNAIAAPATAPPTAPPAAAPAAPQAQAPIAAPPAAPPAALVPPGPRQETPLPRAAGPDPVGELLPEPERPYRFPHREFAQPTIAEPLPGPLQNIPTDPEELNQFLDQQFPEMDPQMRADFLALDPAGREIFMREELLNYADRAKTQQMGGMISPEDLEKAKSYRASPFESPEGEGPFARAVSATAKQISDPLNAILDPIVGVGAPLGAPLPADLSVRNLEQADTQEEFERERLLASRQELQDAFLGLAAGGQAAGGRAAPPRQSFSPSPQGTSPQFRNAGTLTPPKGPLVVQGPVNGSRNTKGFPVRPAPAPVDPLTTLAAESAKAQQAAPAPAPAPAPAAPAPVAGTPGTTIIQTPTGPQEFPAPKPAGPPAGKQIDIPAPVSAPTTQAVKTVKPPVDPVEALAPTPVKAPAPAAVEPTPPAPGPRAPFTPQQQLKAAQQLGSGFPTRVTDLFKSGFTAAELQAEVTAGRMKLTGQGESQLIQLIQPPAAPTPPAALKAQAKAPAKAPDALDTLTTEAKAPDSTLAPTGRKLKPVEQRSLEGQLKEAESQPQKSLTPERFQPDPKNTLGTDDQIRVWRKQHGDALRAEDKALQDNAPGLWSHLSNRDRGLNSETLRDIQGGAGNEIKAARYQTLQDLNAAGRLELRENSGSMGGATIFLRENHLPPGKTIDLTGFGIPKKK